MAGSPELTSDPSFDPETKKGPRIKRERVAIAHPSTARPVNGVSTSES